ncbi:hypothetical protein QYF36_009131 [Acer negundo]|nr:hypothetical protein QYF36_009131 [Acer negundo]
MKLKSIICHFEYCGNSKFQVRGHGHKQYVVDIEKKTCACNKWQLIRILCIHGISALMSSNRYPIDFIDNRYKKASFLKAYILVIYGINGSSMWLKTNDKPLQCPEFKKQSGRPKKARHLQSDEVRVGRTTKLRRNYISVRCSKCRQQDHNKTTCDKRAAPESIEGNAAWTESVGSYAAGIETTQ